MLARTVPPVEAPALVDPALTPPFCGRPPRSKDQTAGQGRNHRAPAPGASTPGIALYRRLPGLPAGKHDHHR
jgi:hypothetical protein